MDKPAAKNQFVIQEHKTPEGVHWDLMLENDGKLWTWRLEIPPGQIHQPTTAERIFDHPLRFLTYEGPVQNGTGRVAIVDKGFLCLHEVSREKIVCEFEGQILRGVFGLRLRHAPTWILSQNA